MSERTSYLAIRDEFLLIAFQYCADKFQNGMVLPWKEGESEWVYAADVLAQKYDMPVEKMMLSVAAVIANAGRIPPFHHKHLKHIHDYLEQNNINQIIDALYTEPNEDEETEEEYFPYDLNRVIHNPEILTPERYGELQRRREEKRARYEEERRKEEEQERLRQERYEQLQHERIMRRLAKKNNKQGVGKNKTGR